MTQPASYGEQRVDRAVEKTVGLTAADERGRDDVRPRTTRRRRRGWAMRRVLLAADVVGLLAAFVVTELALTDFSNGLDPRIAHLFLLFIVSLPVWVVAAKLYGLYTRKGTIAVGSDADLAIWDPDRENTVRWADLHDNVGYSPYEGRRITGWPITVISRGRPRYACAPRRPRRSPGHR